MIGRRLQLLTRRESCRKGGEWTRGGQRVMSSKDPPNPRNMSLPASLTPEPTVVASPASADSFESKYRTALEVRLVLASRLAEAEARTNALVCDVRLVRAEADALRSVLVKAGVVNELPSRPSLSRFVEAFDTADPSSLAIDPATGRITNACVHTSDERSFRPPRNRASSGSIPVDSPPIPTPQSHTRTPPIATTPAKHDSVPTPRRPSTASSTNSKKSVASQGVPTPVNPLPPQSLAWTDIIRTRYPHFQRSTVQTSKHAREFIESRGIPFFRVTPTHSLGRSKPTYAIPPHIHKEFLDYFEDKFGTEGAVLGRRRVGGDRTPGDPGYDDARAAVEGNGWGGVWKETGNAEDGIEAGPVSSCVGKRKASLAGASVTESTASKRRLSSQDGMEEGVKTEGPIAVTTPAVLEKITVDATAFPTADGSKSKKTSSSKSVSKSGLVLTRYNSIVNKMMPEFKNLANDARVAIKRGVKQYLQHELGAAFDECLMTTGSGSDASAAKQTYGVPEHLIAGFRDWVYVELKKCFPDLLVLDHTQA